MGASLSLNSSLSPFGKSVLEVCHGDVSYHLAQLDSEVMHTFQELTLVKRTGLHFNDAPAKATWRSLPLASF